MRSATIKDVAQLAEVSIKTVSRVLNREPYVRDAVREKVWKVVERLDYQPHPAARSLGAQRTYSIGLILENPHAYSYVKRLIDGVFDSCEARRYTLLLRPVHDEISKQDVRKYVRQTRVDGVVLPAPMGDRADITEELRSLDVPFAQMSPRDLHEDWMSAQPADEQACCALLEQIHALGHRRVGFIKGDPEHGATHRRLQGYLESVEKFNLDTDPSLIVEGEFDFESGHAGALLLLGLEHRPTVIVASNDDMASGAIVAARQCGLTVPDDVSVVGFDDSPIAQQTYPLLTTMRQPIYAMASSLTHMLIDRLHGHEPKQMAQEYPCELVMRDSLAPIA